MRILYSFMLLLLLLVPDRTFGQYRIKKDKNFQYRSDSVLLANGITHANFRTVIFELRFWIKDQSGVNANKLFILQQFKNNFWLLQSYQICIDFSSNHYIINKRPDTLEATWAKAWNKLLSNKILSLPDEGNVKKKWRASDGSSTLTSDGVLYIFELSTRKSMRSFRYSNPETILANYDLNNHELVFANEIIKILDSQLNFKGKDLPCN